jgi:hypothetical protein
LLTSLIDGGFASLIIGHNYLHLYRQVHLGRSRIAFEQRICSFMLRINLGQI